MTWREMQRRRRAKRTRRQRSFGEDRRRDNLARAREAVARLSEPVWVWGDGRFVVVPREPFRPAAPVRHVGMVP